MPSSRSLLGGGVLYGADRHSAGVSPMRIGANPATALVSTVRQG
jgi:hypothetical protein